MPLSEFAARKAKPRDKPYKLSDGGGLYLHVQSSGSKLWRLKYRYQGKEKLLSYGPYPQITIAEARVKREASKKLLREGRDPSVQKRLDRIAERTAHRNTFGLIASEYLSNLEANEVTTSTLAKNRWLLQGIASSLSSRPIKDISSAEILDLLKRIEKSGRRETTRRLRSTISAVFRLAIVTLRAENDPTTALRGALLPPKPKGRAAIIEEADFGALLCSVDSYDGWPSITAALNFLILTCVRPGEVRGAVRSEFDLAKEIWRIPAERMKMRRPHNVPLSRQAIAILEDVWMLSEDAELVFPSVRTNKRPLSENAFNSAMRRMGYTKEEVTSHGFRVTASTILNSRGFDPDVIEAVLAHQDRNTVRRAYNRSTYWDQRVVLMQQWADLLDEFRLLKK